MDVVDARLEHGLTVIPRQQTQGRGIIFHFWLYVENSIMVALFPGRHDHKWLSPIGSAMFTLQVHISMMSNLGRYISLLQHIAAVALVSAVRSIKGYEVVLYRFPITNYDFNLYKNFGFLYNIL